MLKHPLPARRDSLGVSNAPSANLVLKTLLLIRHRSVIGQAEGPHRVLGSDTLLARPGALGKLLHRYDVG